MRKLLFIILLIGIPNIICAQKRVLHKHKTTKSNVASPKAFYGLSTTASCGLDGLGQIEIYTGSVVERQFEKDNVTLNGFTLMTGENKPVLINIDIRHVENISSSSLSTLSRFLAEKRKVKVSAYRCLAVRYAFEIESP